MSTDRYSEIKKDCLVACAAQTKVRDALGMQHISVTGGTGFLGSWIAETIAALNDEYRMGITLDLYARNILEWAKKYPHLSKRSDIRLISQDVRSTFEFDVNTNLVVHAAGLPNNRLHSSEPLRVYQTTVLGVKNALDAASQLNNLRRFVNVSSCLVSGPPNCEGPLTESDYFPMPCGQLHTIYAEAKRSAEGRAAIYRNQFRMPISTVRTFAFAGPYQELDRPWALNSFIRDILTGNDIRIHGDGSARRSYLYGSDAACWTLTALIKGMDGAIYNIGSSDAVTHLELVKLIGAHASAKPHIVLNTVQLKKSDQDDLYPDTTIAESSLGVEATCSLQMAIDKTWRWFSLN